MVSGFPDLRMRRLRRTPSLRSLFDRPPLAPQQLMWPVFVRAGAGVQEPIEAMPGQARMSPDILAPSAMMDGQVAAIIISYWANRYEEIFGE